MKIGIVTRPNQKGQIVIPKTVRDKLGITPDKPLNLVVRGGGVYLYPISAITADIEKENTFLQILKKTQGITGPGPFYKNEKLRRKTELAASAKRRKEW